MSDTPTLLSAERIEEIRAKVAELPHHKWLGNDEARDDMIRLLAHVSALSEQVERLTADRDSIYEQVGYERREFDARLLQHYEATRRQIGTLESMNDQLLAALASREVLRPLVIQVNAADMPALATTPRTE